MGSGTASRGAGAAPRPVPGVPRRGRPRAEAVPRAGATAPLRARVRLRRAGDGESADPEDGRGRSKTVEVRPPDRLRPSWTVSHRPHARTSAPTPTPSIPAALSWRATGRGERYGSVIA